MAKKKMLFRVHIKSCHTLEKPKCQFTSGDTGTIVASALNQLIMNYLVTYPLGKIQLKWTYNVEAHYFYLESTLRICFKGIDGLFRIAVREKSIFHVNDKDRDGYGVYAISASKKDLAEHNVHHQNKWIADC